MNEASLGRIDGILATATRELFQSLGKALAPFALKPAELKSPLTATIGFTAAELRGLLVLTLERELAVQTLPANLRSGTPGDAIVADWAGELSNQLLGRLKNGFHASGVDIALSTPIVFVGKELRHFTAESPIRRTLAFDAGRVQVELQGSCDPSFELREASAEQAPAPESGDALFF